MVGKRRMIRPGDIGLGAKRSGFYPKAVRFFTKSKYSHVFMVIHPIYGELSVLETDLKVQCVSFDKEYGSGKNADKYKIFRPIAANESELYNALRYTYATHAGDVYGFFQIPWFAYRAILSLFGITVSRNWFPDGQICSETPLIYLQNINSKYKKAFDHLTPNETSPEDIAKVVESRPDLFQFITERV